MIRLLEPLAPLGLWQLRDGCTLRPFCQRERSWSREVLKPLLLSLPLNFTIRLQGGLALLVQWRRLDLVTLQPSCLPGRPSLLEDRTIPLFLHRLSCTAQTP